LSASHKVAGVTAFAPSWLDFGSKKHVSNGHIVPLQKDFHCQLEPINLLFIAFACSKAKREGLIKVNNFIFLSFFGVLVPLEPYSQSMV
jgi:hypothetical protein